jgi:hypothetical protein
VVSELTIGPAFQGNLTKILRARKQQHTQVSDVSSVKTASDKGKASSPPKASSISSSLPISNHPLMKELSDWKLEHSR